MDKIINKKRAASRRVLATGLALACLLSTLLITTVHATNIGQATITVEQILINDTVYTMPWTTFTYQLIPETIDAPMPYGSNSNGYTFTISGASNVNLGSISFSSPGIFVYTLRCTTGSASGFTIDRRVYTIEVHVTNESQVTVIVYANGDVKVPGIYFKHIYRMHPSGPTNPTNPNRPIYIPPSEPNLPSEPYTPHEPEILEVPDAPSEPTILPEPSGPNEHEPNEYETPDTPSQPSTPGDSPKTGDFSNRSFWIVSFAIASTLLALIILLNWKHRRRSNH